jgi:hypothetical protein
MLKPPYPFSGGVTAGDAIDITSDVISVDIAGTDTVAPTGLDLVLIADVSDNDIPKQITIDDLKPIILDSLAVTVPEGGTGVATLEEFAILMGADTAPVDFISVVGTSAGDVLTSNGDTLAPSFQALPSSGLDFIGRVTAAAAATADVEYAFAVNTNYVILGSNVKALVNNVTLNILFKIGGVWVNSGYLWNAGGSEGGTTIVAADGSDPSGILNSPCQMDDNADSSAIVELKLFDPTNTTSRKLVGGSMFLNSVTDGDYGELQFMVGNTSTAAIEGIRFFMSSGNITGIFDLYEYQQ